MNNPRNILSAIALFASVSTATAQQYLNITPIPCETYEKSIELTSKYNELTLFKGVASQDWFNRDNDIHTTMYVIEVRVNQLTGTYSVVQVYKNGTSCLLAAGTEFEPYSQ